VDEKFPSGGRPFFLLAVGGASKAVETNALSSDEVELHSQVGQGDTGLDPCDDALHFQQRRCPAEERIIIGVQSKRVVSEETANVKKEAGAAAQIKNTQRRCAIEPQILRALHVYSDPIVGVLESIDRRRTRPKRILLAQFTHLFAINCRENFSSTDRMEQTNGVFPRALQRLTRKELSNFMRQSHRSTILRGRLLRLIQIRLMCAVYTETVRISPSQARPNFYIGPRLIRSPDSNRLC